MTTEVLNSRELLEKSYKNDILNSLSKVDDKDLSKKKEDVLDDFFLPHKKIEDWKYTSIEKFIPAQFKSGADKTDIPTEIENFPADLVFQGGILKLSNELPNGVKIDEVTNELLDLDILSKINFLGATKSYKIEVSGVLTRPLRIAHIQQKNQEQTISFPKIIVHSKAQTQATLVEVFTGDEDISYTVNPHITFTLDNGAHLTHVKANIESDHVTHLSTVNAKVSRDATFTSFSFTNGGKLSRNNVHVSLKQENATANVHGLYALKNEQHCDNFITVEHAVSHTYSDQLFKGILSDKSHGIFTGKVLVQRDAQQIDSTQLNKNLLLSDKAKVNTRPQLEVYADDVKCAHGATIGQLSPEEVFYLESRGIEQTKAKKILCRAFGADVLDKIKCEQTKTYLAAVLFERFERFALEGIS